MPVRGRVVHEPTCTGIGGTKNNSPIGGFSVFAQG